MAARKQKAICMPTLANKSMRPVPAIVVMFRVVDTVNELPRDLSVDSAEGQALLGARVPNGWVGMACGQTPVDLFWCIDQFVDPYAVELRLVPNGGMCVYSPDYSVLPARVKAATLDEVGAHIAATGVTDLEFTDEVAFSLDTQPPAEASDDDDDGEGGNATWAQVLQAYAGSVKEGKWFTPKWPQNLYD